ncbi:hypothetical protein BGX30_000932 [Mortierella sp. GBA39]|nr:hypothetical protein BGX30_000932 [Mortierella sp. GBA39]
MGMERTEVFGFVQDGDDDAASLTPEEESAVQQEAKDREKRQCYTFPAAQQHTVQPPSSSTTTASSPTFDEPTVEDRIESIYLEKILSETDSNIHKVFGFSSDDPGLCTMQVSSTLTYGQVSQHILRYFETPNPFGYDMLDTDDGRQSLDEAVVDLPPTSKITAPLLNDLTFSR